GGKRLACEIDNGGASMNGIGRLGVALTMLAGAALLPALAAAAPKDGGTLSIGMPAKVVGFDAYTIKGIINYDTALVGGMIFGNLLALDADGKQVPSQALSVAWSADNKTATVKLRPGMKFSDGSPYDAAPIV